MFNHRIAIYCNHLRTSEYTLSTWTAGTANGRTDTGSKITKHLAKHLVVPIVSRNTCTLSRQIGCADDTFQDHGFSNFLRTKIPSSKYHNSTAARGRYMCWWVTNIVTPLCTLFLSLIRCTLRRLGLDHMSLSSLRLHRALPRCVYFFIFITVCGC
jgi:hypothetical protein